MYEELLRAYRFYWSDAKRHLEKDISKLLKKGLSRSEAIKRLFIEKIGDPSILKKPSRPVIRTLTVKYGDKTATARIYYQGDKIAVAYLDMDPFTEKLEALGALLEAIEEKGEVMAIIPNVGLTGTSFILGTDFQGVKGVAIIYRIRNCTESE